MMDPTSLRHLCAVWNGQDISGLKLLLSDQDRLNRPRDMGAGKSVPPGELSEAAGLWSLGARFCSASCVSISIVSQPDLGARTVLIMSYNATRH
jgi:hypothetical protein